MISALTAIFCFVPLKIVIEGAVVVRIIIMFIGQIVALHLVRRSGKHPMPFRMWLYPLPALIALVGWILLLAAQPLSLLILLIVVYVSGVIAYFVRNWLVPRAPSA
jgi:hypothetical protein